APFTTRETLNVRTSGSPERSAPVVGSLRMSDRFSFSSLKYGPSVSAGRTTHEAVPVAVDVVESVAAAAVRLLAPLPHPARMLTLASPRSAMASRRERMVPTGRSSLSLIVESLQLNVR